MKRIFATIPSTAALAVVFLSLLILDNQASVTILTTSVRGMKDENNIAISTGTLGLVVVDTGNNGFGNLTPSSITAGSFIGDGDDWIAGRVSSQEAFGQVFFELSSIPSINLSTSPTNPGPGNQNDSFTFIWLPGLGASVTTVAEGQAYGQVRPSDTAAVAVNQEAWRLPADGNDVNGFDIVNAGPATQTVSATAVPEPSTSMLMIVAISSMLLRRQRDSE